MLAFRVAVLALICAFDVAACDRTDDAPRCPEGTFDCFGACQPLGSVCGRTERPLSDAGSNDDGSNDDAATVDATSDPCSGRADGRAVVRACADGAIVDCTSGRRTPCDELSECVEWTETGSWLARCFLSYERPCGDEEAESAHCAGDAVLSECYPNLSTGPLEPATKRSRIDCRARWPLDGTCTEARGSPECTSPSAVACDPEAHARRCADDGSGTVECDASLRITYVQLCDASESCRVCTSGVSAVACVPEVAVSSSHLHEGPDFLDRLYCVDPSRIRVERCGYEWTARCPVGQPLCLETPTGTIDCFPEGSEPCDSDTYARHCSSDGRESIYCSSTGLVASTSCDAGGGSCSLATGDCAVPAP